MALQWQKVFIPVAKGLGQAIDERVRSADVLSRATNCTYDRGGVLVKRRGFSKMAAVDQDDDALASGVRSLVSTGDELLMLHKCKLYGYHDTWARWVDKGWVSPACGEQHTIYHSDKTHLVVDVSLEPTSGWCLYAAAREHEQAEAGLETDLFCEIAWFVRHKNDQQVMPAAFLPDGATATTNVKHHSPRCFYGGDRLYGAYMKGLTNPCQLRMVRWATKDTDTTDPTDVVQFTNDCKYLGKNVRTYDAIGLSNGTEFAVAYIKDADDDIELEFWTALTSTKDRAVTIGGTYTKVAICEDTKNDQILVFVLAQNEPEGLVLFGYDITTAAKNFGPERVREVPDQLNYPSPDPGGDVGYYADNLGVASGDVGGTQMACCTWDEAESVNYDTYVNACYAIGPCTDWDEDLATEPHVIYNATTRSRPFYYGGRFYAHYETRVAQHIWYPPVDVMAVGDTIEGEHDWGHFNHAWVWEAGFVAGMDFTGALQASPHRLAAILDVGTGGVDSQRRRGNGANVIYATSGEFRWMTTSMQYSFQYGTQSGVKTDGSELRFDFGATPTAAVVHRGALAIGGGFVAWYDGGRTQELGHAVAPIVDYYEHYNHDYGQHNATTIRHQCIWVSYDDKGILHRSLPSIVTTTQPGSGDPGNADDATMVHVRTNPATLRLNAIHDGFILYRDDDTSSGIYSRVTEPKRFEPNISTSNVTGGLEDYGQDLAGAIYTTGGAEIEAVCPEGARFVTVAGGRMWIGDSWRRDRVSYSKPVAPGSAAEQAIAPEFNEGFTYLLDSGQTVTAMSSMDDKLVIFTDERIYMITGAGPDDGGRNNSFSGLQLIAGDSGCIDARSVVSGPDGIYYQSDAGIMMLDRGLQTKYIGEPVADELSSYPTITSGVLIASETQVRWTAVNTSGDDAAILVHDYSTGTWVKWFILDGLSVVVPISACEHDGSYYIAELGGQVWEQQATYGDRGDSFTISQAETGWLQLAEQAGWKRVRRVDVMARREGAHNLRVDIYTDFDDTTPTTTQTFSDADLQAMPDADNVVLCAITPVVQKCTAIKVKVTDADATPSDYDSAGFSLTGVTLEFGIKRGKMRAPHTQRN